MAIDLATEQPLTVKQAAELLSKNQATIHRWFDQGLEYKKLGRCYYTTREALDRFSDRFAPPPTPEPARRGSRRHQDIAKRLREEYGFK